MTFQPKLVPGIDKLLVIDQGHQIKVGSAEEIYTEYGYLNDIITNDPSEVYTDPLCPVEEED